MKLIIIDKETSWTVTDFDRLMKEAGLTGEYEDYGIQSDGTVVIFDKCGKFGYLPDKYTIAQCKTDFSNRGNVMQKIGDEIYVYDLPSYKKECKNDLPGYFKIKEVLEGMIIIEKDGKDYELYENDGYEVSEKS